jgi:gamma-tubulin complex component 2
MQSSPFDCLLAQHVERQLCSTWMSHQTTKELDLRSALGPDYCLRQRMLHFLQNYQYYVMFEVLEPRWHELEHNLENVNTVDELMNHHTDFLDTCLRECLLTHQGLIKTLAKLMTTCLLFAQQIGRFAEQLHIDEDSMKQAVLQDAAASGSKGSLAGASEADQRRRKRKPSPSTSPANTAAAKEKQQVCAHVLTLYLFMFLNKYVY